ncbi:MAG TPA: hypothetical protein VF588_04980 [Pyrinomonadaceae bacterium]|jgi:hypothetical protein
MSEEKKYVTFRDLRVVTPAQKPITSPASTSTSSIPSTSDLPAASSVSTTVDKEDETIDTSATPEPPTSTSIPRASSSTSATSISRASSNTSTTGKLIRSENKPEQAEQQALSEKPKRSAIAPERDFQRIPNSITRKAIPEGLFRGKSKQVWDYLWSVTRGAIVPVTTTRKSRREIKAGSGLGSMVTVDAALEHLESVGLVAVRQSVGSLSGNEYEVFTPDEAYTSTSSTPSTSRITQKVDELDVLESSSTSTTQTIEKIGGSSPPNTSFKTIDINTDDEAFAEFAAAVKKTAKEITGREPSKAEAARWGEVAEVLMTELRIAASRTNVSSVPAFLAEHLRRRLWKKEKRQMEAEAAEQKASARSKKIDASKCPDCAGTGLFYPDGFDKGVARCPHSKLMSEVGE